MGVLLRKISALFFIVTTLTGVIGVPVYVHQCNITGEFKKVSYTAHEHACNTENTNVGKAMACSASDAKVCCAKNDVENEDLAFSKGSCCSDYFSFVNVDVFYAEFNPTIFDCVSDKSFDFQIPVFVEIDNKKSNLLRGPPPIPLDVRLSLLQSFLI